MQELLSAYFCKFYRLTVAAFLFSLPAAAAQDAESRNVVVEAEELPSAYGAPPDLSRGRISTLTKAYVLAPCHFEVETLYEGNFTDDHPPRHTFSAEIEMGLPGRFTVGIQNQVDRFNRDTQERGLTLEGRYALADWNKIPLNPTIAADYRFGFDKHPDAIDFGLLFCHDFAHMIEWAANISGEKSLEGSGRPAFRAAQSLEIPVLLPEEKLELGLEMQYRDRDEPRRRHDSGHGFAVGPTLAWRPTKILHFDLSPLIGCTGDAPRLDLFAAISFSFGGPESSETESPASSRGH